MLKKDKQTKTICLAMVIEFLFDVKLKMDTVETSPVYEEFLSVLGQKIELKGWTNYRGGLDVKSKH